MICSADARPRNSAPSARCLAPAQDVVDVPVPLLLTNQCLTDHPGLLEHLVGRLKHSLQVGWVPLGQGELIAQPVQGNAPCQHPVGPRELEEPVESARNR